MELKPPSSGTIGIVPELGGLGSRHPFGKALEFTEVGVSDVCRGVITAAAHCHACAINAAMKRERSASSRVPACLRS